MAQLNINRTTSEDSGVDDVYQNLALSNVPTTALSTRPSRAQAEAAVHTLIRWAGDDPEREGLLDTPARVVRAYEEYFRGYDEDPYELLGRTFDETEGYDEMVVLKDFPFASHCEHHIAPIIGKAHVAYLPDIKVVGISQLARLV